MIAIHTGPNLVRQPDNAADAEATVRDLISLGADFQAGPLEIRGMDFATLGVTPLTVFDPCSLAHLGSDAIPQTPSAATTVSGVTALLRHTFGARITDTIRPMNAAYGARYSWHKFGQAVDFVPAGGVDAVDREQIRRLMVANGVRLIELLGPGDPGHANHWHVAFARPGQVIDHLRPIEEDEDWVVTVASADGQGTAIGRVDAAPASISQVVQKTPPQWDVFGQSGQRAVHGGGS